MISEPMGTLLVNERMLEVRRTLAIGLAFCESEGRVPLTCPGRIE